MARKASKELVARKGSSRRRRPAVILGAIALAILAGAGVMAYTAFRSKEPSSAADPTNPQLVDLGAKVYGDYCAACHGKNLEGQPNWQSRRADGRLPAPPHDETGHTWHHPDRVLFEVTKRGVEAFGVQNYESNMPVFAGTLSDKDIWAVLAYIKSRWPERIQAIQSGIDRRTAQGGSQ